MGLLRTCTLILAISCFYVYGDIVTKSGQPGDCPGLCTSTPGCSSYTWVYDLNGGSCLLMVNVLPVCPAPPTTCVTIPGTDSAGADIEILPNHAQSDCCGLCQANPNCNSWVWNAINGGTCFLKSSVGPFTARADCNLGIVNRANAPCTLAASSNRAGSDIESSTNTSKDACCSKCRANASCQSFAWISDNAGSCWLKNVSGPLTSANQGPVVMGFVAR